MARTKRIITQQLLADRKQMEEQLISIPPLSPIARRLLSPNGFCEIFDEMKLFYPTNIDAYETLETYHIRIFGYHRYSEYSSFRIIYSRFKMNYK